MFITHPSFYVWTSATAASPPFRHWIMRPCAARIHTRCRLARLSSVWVWRRSCSRGCTASTAATEERRRASGYYPSSMPYAYSTAGYPQPAPFPPQGRTDWLQGVLREIASVRAVTSRGKRNPRGVRRKMSRYPIRDRGDPLNIDYNPCPMVIFK